MDLEPDVDSEFDPLSLYLPLPYRVALILVLGVWAWGLNLHYLSIVKIDLPHLIRYPPRSTTQRSYHLSIYRLATLLTIPLAFSLLIFWSLSHGDPALIHRWQILPISYLFLLAAFFFLPVNFISRNGRYRFLSTFKRISIGGLDSDGGKFGDILLADVLTSYAKVLGDLWVAGCMYFSASTAPTKPDRACGGKFIVPLVIAIPNLIRLRQCLIEFVRARRQSQKQGNPESAGSGAQHLANAIKYASAFPVIILSALQRSYDPKYPHELNRTGLFRLWLVAVFVNSFYSFYWDVARDWDLSVFSSHRSNPDQPWGLRRQLHFHTPGLYYAAIILDFLLRCTWSFKLSPHLDHWNDLEGGIFVMELLEVLRRWLWVFLRAETEWVRLKGPPGPGMDDILLPQYGNGKIDED